MSAHGSKVLVIGRIAGAYGLGGWVRVQSYTEPHDQILEYAPWMVGTQGDWHAIQVLAGRPQGSGLVVQLAGVMDRDAAIALHGTEIAIHREQLPPVTPGEYYWADLIGLRVINREGVALGRVDHLFETGANDVLVVASERQRLIPYIRGQVVLEVDPKAGVIRVDWDPEF